jgi:hypothetical protein
MGCGVRRGGFPAQRYGEPGVPVPEGVLRAVLPGVTWWWRPRGRHSGRANRVRKGGPGLRLWGGGSGEATLYPGLRRGEQKRPAVRAATSVPAKVLGGMDRLWTLRCSRSLGKRGMRPNVADTFFQLPVFSGLHVERGLTTDVVAMVARPAGITRNEARAAADLPRSRRRVSKRSITLK